jgi:hypothetical protein|tara:strand:+ start:394 stop:705 length:312 start_codon:yes stop_codon:yes gene_type:complete
MARSPRKRRSRAAAAAEDAAPVEAAPAPAPASDSPACYPCSVEVTDGLFRLLGADGKPMVDDAGRIRDGGGYEDEVKANRRAEAINGEPIKREREQRNADAIT